MSVYDDMLRQIKKQHKEDLEFAKVEARFGIATGFIVGLIIGLLVTKAFF